MPRMCWLGAGLLLWILSLGVTVEPAAAQVPTWENGVWVFPADDGDDAPARQYGGSYEDQIAQACAVYGCDAGWLINVMYCESGGNHGAIGPNGERGLFQYHPYGMWPEMAWAGPSEQIWHAAQMFAAGLSYHWACA